MSESLKAKAVRGWLRKWQKRLRLQDWDIEVSVVKSLDVVDGAPIGYVQHDYTGKVAHIQLVDPKYYPEAYPFPLDDAEAVLVHELGHVLMAELRASKKRSEREMREDYVVDVYADALFALDRGSGSA